MSTTRHPRPTRPGRNPTRRPDAADDALSRLIANAAPPRDYLRELRGEKEAVAAFAKARLHPAAEPRRRLMSAGKLLALKTLIAVIGLSGGSVAVAAATGHLPAQLDGHPSVVSPASPTASARADAQRYHPATLSPPVRGRSAAHPGKGHSAAKSKSAHASHKPKAAKKRPKPHPKAKPSPHPNGKPAPHPKGKPPPHPNGKPAPHPKGKPPPHPNGKPAPHHAAS
jgi:hypothetical protein